MVENLEEQVEYFKNCAANKIDGQDHAEIVNTLEGLVESFKQMQKFYE